jgi:hypothetical protein
MACPLRNPCARSSDRFTCWCGTPSRRAIAQAHGLVLASGDGALRWLVAFVTHARSQGIAI